MKRLFLMAIVALLLIGCSDSAPADALTNMVGRGWEEGVAAIVLSEDRVNVNAEHVWTDMRPLSNTNYAQVTFRVEMAEDVLKTGGSGPFYLYGGGLMKVEEANFTFKDQTPIRGQGTGQLVLSSSDVSGVMHSAYDLPLVGLTAQVDGIADSPITVSVFGAASASKVQSNVLNTNETMMTLKNFQCTGQMIPGSNMARLNYIGETEKGQMLVGAGISLLYDQPAARANGSFDCSMDGKGGVTYRAAIEGIEGAHLVDLVINGLKIRTENGQVITVGTAAVNGLIFEDGNKPGTLNFNIGMPPT